MNVLLIGVILVGLSYGSFWSLGPSILGDLFGGKNFGIIYGMTSLAPAAGSYAFAVGLASTMYQHEIQGGGNTCYGPQCFRATFLILALLCAIACCCALMLAVAGWKYRKSYPLVRSFCGFELHSEEPETIAEREISLSNGMHLANFPDSDTSSEKQSDPQLGLSVRDAESSFIPSA